MGISRDFPLGLIVGFFTQKPRAIKHENYNELALLEL